MKTQCVIQLKYKLVYRIIYIIKKEHRRGVLSQFLGTY